MENATAVRSELMQGEIKAVFPKLDRMDLRFVSCRGRAFGLIIAIVSGPPGDRRPMEIARETARDYGNRAMLPTYSR